MAHCWHAAAAPAQAAAALRAPAAALQVLLRRDPLHLPQLLPLQDSAGTVSHASLPDTSRSMSSMSTRQFRLLIRSYQIKCWNPCAVALAAQARSLHDMEMGS